MLIFGEQVTTTKLWSSYKRRLLSVGSFWHRTRKLFFLIEQFYNSADVIFYYSYKRIGIRNIAHKQLRCITTSSQAVLSYTVILWQYRCLSGGICKQFNIYISDAGPTAWDKFEQSLAFLIRPSKKAGFPTALEIKRFINNLHFKRIP